MQAYSNATRYMYLGAAVAWLCVCVFSYVCVFTTVWCQTFNNLRSGRLCARVCKKKLGDKKCKHSEMSKLGALRSQ